MQKARRHVITTLRPLVGRRVQVYFTPLLGVLFTFPSRYWFAIGLSGVFSLTGWAPLFHARFLVPRATQDATSFNRQSCTGFSPSMTAFSKAFHLTLSCHVVVLQPPCRLETWVWALPCSLATTYGIIVYFLLLWYLDVSVPHVRLPYGMTGLQPAGLPHSDIPGSTAICASPGLFAAYHVLHRLREPRHPPSALAYFLSPRTYVRVDIS